MTQNAQTTKHVSNTNVEIHVQKAALVERVQSVKPKVTELCANVQMDGVAILPQNVFNVG